MELVVLFFGEFAELQAVSDSDFERPRKSPRRQLTYVLSNLQDGMLS